jgi:uncharacterized membrane protein YfcA
MIKFGHNNVRIGFYLFSSLILILLFNQHFRLEEDGIHLLENYWHFLLIGLLAATIANATGAGGGIVFIPAFYLLGMNSMQTLATSFAIQCFGMTSGALAWLSLVRFELAENLIWRQLNKVLLIASVSSLIGLLSIQYSSIQPPVNMHLLLSIFSILVGCIILFSLYSVKRKALATLSLTSFHCVLISISCLIGGAITAWLSIGVGEILAFILILIGFNVRFAIVAAVCVSSITVLAGIPFYINQTSVINVAVLQFAAPAAIIGGWLARYLAVKTSQKNLKFTISLWIIFSGFIYLFVN